MRNQQIRTIWENFISSKKYGSYFTSNEEEWMKNLNNVKKYIDENNKLPNKGNKNESIKKLNIWIIQQTLNYKKNDRIMSRENMRKIWNEFVNSEKYRIYFLSNEEEWRNNLFQVKKYIDDNNKRPSQNNKDKKIKKLGTWIGTQIKNYKNKNNIMDNKIIRNEWDKFINSQKYKKYFFIKG